MTISKSFTNRCTNFIVNIQFIVVWGCKSSPAFQYQSSRALSRTYKRVGTEHTMRNNGYQIELYLWTWKQRIFFWGQWAAELQQCHWKTLWVIFNLLIYMHTLSFCVLLMCHVINFTDRPITLLIKPIYGQVSIKISYSKILRPFIKIIFYSFTTTF